MFNTFYATKLDVTQAFDHKGRRLVVTRLQADPLTITQLKTLDKDKYWSLQCAIGQKSKKSLKQPQAKKLKQANLKQPPMFYREIKLDSEPKLKPGDQIKVADVFSPGDQIKATAVTKGKGFTGVIKRWGFHGGPRTHGQSDRQRAPGSIGQGTDPGRVWKGKKMPGHHGAFTKSIRGLQIIKLDEDKNLILLTGTIPGHRNSLVKLTKTGTVKHPVKLFSPSDKASAKPDSKKSTSKPESQSTSKPEPAEESKPAPKPGSTKESKPTKIKPEK